MVGNVISPDFGGGSIEHPIYGAEWAGTSDPSWTRTDAAVGFSSPNPYYAGMSTTPSSPFDNIMPWSGMRRVTDANAGELVEIPKFYYKWTRDGVKMKLQISMSQFDGSYVSPAHADRGDGVGERDYVYVGRYHCASDYKSKTGVIPITQITRATARTNIHNLGNNIWQHDIAMLWTIRMLYLVEFANWNSQSCIGYGCGNDSGMENVGASDNMPYHTGTMKSNCNTYGVGVQYRHIEGLWENAYDFTDGVYFSSNNIYIITNPANFSDSSGGVNVGTRGTSAGFISSLSETISNYNWAMLNKDVNGSSTTYLCDAVSAVTGTILYSGGGYGQSQNRGLFYMGEDMGVSSTGSSVGSRLMVLPPSRLSA